VLSAVSFAALVKERAGAMGAAGGFWGAVRDLPRPFRRFLVGVGVFGAGDFAHSLLTLRAAQMLTPSLGAAQAGQVAIALYATHNVFYAGMAYPVGWLSDRIGKRGLLALGWIFAPPSPLLLGALFALGGTFIATEDTLEGALAADLLPAERRGTGYGVLATVNGAGDFVSSVVVGALWTAASPAAGFAYAGVLFVAGALVIFRLR